ncbi:hypothetical protein SBA2_280012 [Acidobacteriia bacterium SbA2]|nr:hypothetical protein SBA2_280012 [Acidobacteriia bacterium SbA2]
MDPVSLSPEQQQLEHQGEAVEVPTTLQGDNLCLSRCLWFLTGDQDGLPPPEPIGAWSRDFLGNDKRFHNLFYTASILEARPLKDLRCFCAGEYLVRVCRRDQQQGHWVVLTREGVFDPGFPRKSLPVDLWTNAFDNVYVIARVYQYTSGQPRSVAS